MSRTTRALPAVLVGALLATILVAFTPGDDPEAKATLGPLQAVTLGAADFHPVVDGGDFSSSGGVVISDTDQMARIPFPAGVVVITSVKVRGKDDHGAADLCAYLYRTESSATSSTLLGSVCTSGSNPASLQTLSIPAVYTRIGGYNTAYLLVDFYGTKSLDLELYGATVFYRVVS